ncbi:MAG: Dna2/Cas4 domain-containing protein, partial [Bdellovibrionales bacterium]|nr:Dna2/Cas4 domain-containing protein [Bdellovibrionales bacterium]
MSRLALSKSRYCLGERCPKALYLQTHEPELAAPLSEGALRTMEEGTLVGAEARKYFPSGVLIEADFREPEQALLETQRALERGASVLFEAAFVYKGTFVRVDILEKNGHAWDLIEVKSSTQVKDEHVSDLAIQHFVLEGNAMRVQRTWLMHLNRECRYPRLQELFVKSDCTDRVKKRENSVGKNIEALTKMLGENMPPAVEIGPYCDSPRPCVFKAACWAHLPAHSVFELHGTWASTKFKLYERG